MDLNAAVVANVTVHMIKPNTNDPLCGAARISTSGENDLEKLKKTPGLEKEHYSFATRTTDIVAQVTCTDCKAKL